MKRLICSLVILSGLVFVGMGCGDDKGSEGKACPQTLENDMKEFIISLASLGKTPTKAELKAMAVKCDALVNPLRSNVGCKGSGGKIMDKEIVSQFKAACQDMHNGKLSS